MDRITKSPGLHHILEEIFVNLNYPSIFECLNVNTIWREVLNGPTIRLKHPEISNFLTCLQQLKQPGISNLLNILQRGQSNGFKITEVKLVHENIWFTYYFGNHHLKTHSFLLDREISFFTKKSSYWRNQRKEIRDHKKWGDAPFSTIIKTCQLLKFRI